jgi:integrase
MAGVAMGRPKKLVPELWYQESESCWMAKFNGRRRRYGPDREQALERFRADLAIHLSGGQVGPAKVATAPSALIVAELCQAHLDRVKDRLSAKAFAHHRTATIALVDGWGHLPAESFGLQEIRAFRDRLASQSARVQAGPARLLWSLLRSGPVASAEVEKVVLAAGHSLPSYRRARAMLGVAAYRTPACWMCRLPEGLAEPSQPRTLARTYVNKLVGVVQILYRQAAVRGEVSAAKAAEVCMLPPLEYQEGGRETAARLPALAADVSALLASLREPWLTLCRLQAATGMRPGEALAFRWDSVSRSHDQPVNVEAGGNVVTVSAVTVGETVVWIYAPGKHKTRRKRKARLIALGVKAQAILAPWLDRPGYTFGTKKGKRARNTDDYGKEIRRRCRRLGITPWTPHQLRHGFATAAAQTGDPADLQAQLGHSSAAMTAHYIANLAARAARLAE